MGGGGVACRKSKPAIYNNVIINNSADSAGGGLHFEKEGDAYVYNNIIRGNGKSTGIEISVDGGSPDIRYCNIRGGWKGQGNIDMEPCFRDPQNRNYHLMSVSCGDTYDSPCIDAGDPAVFDLELGCNAGLGKKQSDIGAFGGF